MKLPLLYPVACFAGGILLSSHIINRVHAVPVFFIAASVLLLVDAYVLLRRQWILTAAILGLFVWVCLGFAASILERDSVSPELASSLIETGKLDATATLRWHGRLRSDPLQLPWGTRYEINLDRVESSTGVTPVSGGLRLTSYHDQMKDEAGEGAGDDANDGAKESTSLPVRAGDAIEVLVHALPIRNFGDPGSFDQRTSLDRQGIQLQGTLRNPKLLTIVGHPRLTISDRMARARGRLLNSLNDIYALRPDEAALARAMLLGDRSFVDRDVVTEFQQTGVYHVLVLAGLHVGALMAFFVWAGRRMRLGLFSRTLLTLIALAAYAGIVEDRPPIVRAVLMAAIYLSAQVLYRRMDLLNVAALAALAILAVRPSEIVDPSFLLSFSAVGIIGALAVPWIANSSELYRRGLDHLSDVTRDVAHPPHIIQFRMELRAATAWLSGRIPKFANPIGSAIGHRVMASQLRASFYLWDLVVISAVLQLGMLPPMAYYFHRVTLAGPFANVPAVLLTGLAVPIGFFALASSLVSRGLAIFFAKLLGLFLVALSVSVHWFARWDQASYRIPGPPLVVIGIFATVVILLSATIRSRMGAWWQFGAAAALVATALIIAAFPFTPHLSGPNLELTVLDVGQGDSLFVSFPDRSTMLVDGGGELGSFHSGGMHAGLDVGEDVVSPYLWSRGLKAIDVIALTHAHQDHLGGLPAILENFRVGELWVGRDIESSEYRHVLEVARERGVRIRHLKQGDSFVRGNVTGNILWPDDPSEGRVAKNDDSLVIRLTDGSQSLLLAGDIERPSERKILSEDQTVSVNFLKVAHHGSKTSTIDPFLAAAHPAFAAISVGRDNSFGHPSPEVIDRLEAAGVRVYRTDRDGAVTALTDGSGLTVSSFLPHVPAVRQVATIR